MCNICEKSTTKHTPENSTLCDECKKVFKEFETLVEKFFSYQELQDHFGKIKIDKLIQHTDGRVPMIIE